VQRVDVLKEAWRRVKANGGAAGVDGVSIDELKRDAQLEAAWLNTLREELHRKQYRPAPVLRVYIPKASGGLRPLGIPTVKDRVVQMAVYLVLMPIFEADFDPHSYGYRPKRSAPQAMAEIRRALRTGRTEVVDADLAQFFDTIPHRELLRQVARRVSDGMILKLIKGWLRAPIVEHQEGGGRTMKANACGTPQGGVISPLLANIYLHPLDEEINGQAGPQARMVRYADDLVICGPAGNGAKLKERLTRWLTAKGLMLNERKTRVVQSRESGFVFLGFAFRWQKSRRGKEYVHVTPSRVAEQALRERIRAMTHHRTTWKATAEVVGEINRVSRGWAQYFAASHHARSFRQMNHFITERLRRWLRNKHQTAGMYARWPDEVLHEAYGLERLAYVWTKPS
jgi:group II intron reverse transcriptase/maturase